MNTCYGNNDWRDYLSHHGIPGQEHGKRRFQNPDGSLTPEGRERYGIGPPRNGGSPMTKREIRAEQRAVKKVIKSEKKAAKIEAKNAKKVAKEEEEIRRVVSTGNATEIKKIQNKLTDEQLAAAIERVRKTQTLDSLRANDFAVGKQKIESIAASLGNIATLAENGIKIYNTAAKINNAFNQDGEMRLIGTDKSLKSQRAESAQKAEDNRISDIIKRGSISEIMENIGSMNKQQATDAKNKLEAQEAIASLFEKYKNQTVGDDKKND